jgi:prevent-host-death family protein
MQAIGLFQAKTHLSEYVARAEAGEEVVIMRHNKAVAKIVPMEKNPRSFDLRERAVAIEALLAFKRIEMPGVDLKSLIEEGRE